MSIKLATDTNFESLINEDFVIVDFFSTTCVPCKIFSTILEDINAEIPFVNIVKANITDYPVLAEKYSIYTVPNIYFYKDGEVVETHIGVMQPNDVKKMISKYMY